MCFIFIWNPLRRTLVAFWHTRQRSRVQRLVYGAVLGSAESQHRASERPFFNKREFFVTQRGDGERLGAASAPRDQPLTQTIPKCFKRGGMILESIVNGFYCFGWNLETFVQLTLLFSAAQSHGPAEYAQVDWQARPGNERNMVHWPAQKVYIVLTQKVYIVHFNKENEAAKEHPRCYVNFLEALPYFCLRGGAAPNRKFTWSQNTTFQYSEILNSACTFSNVLSTFSLPFNVLPH